MDKTFLEQAITTYFDTLKKHGRTVSEGINPMQRIIDDEVKFLPYLDKNDLYCMFCNELLVVIVIDWKLQRPVWGCLKDSFMKSLQKIKWEDHCAECGVELHLEPKELADQKEHMEADNVKTVCDKCIGNGNILTDEDMKDVHTKKLAN